MANEKKRMAYWGWYVLALLLSLAAIVLLVLAMRADSEHQQTLLFSGMFCTNTGLVLCIWRNRKHRRNQS